MSRSPADLTFPEFSEEYLRITPKLGGVVPFVLNKAQMRVDAIIEERRAAGKPVRIIILKARQMGFSTYSLGRMYHYSTTQRGVTTFLAAHDEDSTRDLFERVRLMYEMAPARPMSRKNNRMELDFANPDPKTAKGNPGLQSKIRIGTAGKSKLGRSKTLRYLHLSEVAFWDNAKRVLLGLEQALPDDPATVQIIESTANGVGGEFYDRWQRSQNPEEAGDWIGVFFPWWEFDEYRRPIEAGAMVPVPSSVVDREEFRVAEGLMKAQFDLDDDQLNWRRWAIVNKCGNDLDLFHQEYPTTPQEAFLTSGRPIFNARKLVYRHNELTALDLRISASDGTRRPRGLEGDIRRKGAQVRFVPKPDGPLMIYRMPERGREYWIGADACRGIVSPKNPDPDFAEAHVYDSKSWEQVAVYRDRIEASKFAKVVTALGWYFGGALLIPESNDHGNTVIVSIQNEGYPNLYVRHDTDKMGMEPIKRFGWENNRKTRPQVVDAVDDAINEDLATFNDIPTIEQMMTFVRNPSTGKPEADIGCHDDGVIASGLVFVVAELQQPGDMSNKRLDLDRLPPEQSMVMRDILRQKRAVVLQRNQAWGNTQHDENLFGG